MFAEFEIKLSEESNWNMYHLNVYLGVYVAKTENDYKRKLYEKVLKDDLSFLIEEHLLSDKKDKETKYYILTIKSKDDKILVRSTSRLPLEYLCFHAGLDKKQLMRSGGPLTFYPHLNTSESPLDDDNKNKQNYDGFLNLMVLILFFSQFRLIYENYLKYGFLLSSNHFGELVFDKKNQLFVSLSLLIYASNVIICFAVERILARKASNFGYALHLLNLVYLLVGPLLFHKLDIVNPIVGIGILSIGIVMLLKLMSYIHFWHDVRFFKANKEIFIKNENKELQGEMFKEILEVIDNYPKSLRINELLYFLVCPVLCFQYKYPRTDKIRKRNVFLYGVQLIIATLLQLFIVRQYIVPLVRNSIVFFENDDYLNIFERILKLAIPNVYVWLLGFYGTFHCQLNLLAELTRFADRVFYKDWWNSLYLNEYWRTWNLPTHYWLMRHIFIPLKKLGFTNSTNAFGTFLFSALFHEYVISGALGIWSYWAFLAMLLNFPMSNMQETFKKSKFGRSKIMNYFFWISFCFIGQPLCVLIYFWLYYKKYGTAA